ncbi:inosine monophosphate dehydrogenase [Teratosphaeria nubilosa]|uniref:Inosine monophosphate dehydrogenase n=1 Tax=Teratosphaeria nubilosa TaxID=161662 RepID=A0A6G1KX19_9PEZI|nr:inosine monophosphate dehydrogenase [Teratosphaeria nubilosa]
MASRLVKDYPWAKAPLVACGPMRLIALSSLAFEVSNAGGLGFVGAGSDVSTLDAELSKVKEMCSSSSELSSHKDVLPVGVGFLLWAGEQLLNDALPVLEKFRPAAVWLFAPSQDQQLVDWTEQTRHVTDGKTRIWVQIGTVADAINVTKTCKPDVLVVQGGDAGGHGLEKCAGLVSLVPEVDDAVGVFCKDHAIKKPHLVAAGGIMDGRGAAAAVALGTQGVVMGTRYLASPEANIAKGYRDAVIKASDGGVSTQRGKLYDTLRGTTDWPHRYGGRGVLNETWYDAAKGMSMEENKKLYDEALKKGDEGWGSNARLTTYAGTGVGLVKEVKGAAAVTFEVRDGANAVLKSLCSSLQQ